MTVKVLDYSFARPDPAAMRAIAVGVVRYLGFGPKVLDAAERDRLHAVGLTIGLVWETTATMMDRGAAGGTGDAQDANRQADALGFPATRPIYFANDQNQASSVHVQYMTAAKAASKRPVGVYGSTALVDACAALGITYGWKVSTWGPATANACLTQEANTPSPIPGTDMNYAHRDDWGQWPYDSPVVDQEDVAVKIVLNKDSQQGVALVDGQIVRSLGQRVFGVFGSVDTTGKFVRDEYANTLVAVYGPVVELAQAQFEVLPAAPVKDAAVRALTAWLASMFKRKAAKNPPPVF